MTVLRHQLLNTEWAAARDQLQDNVADAEDAFAQRVVGRLVELSGYVATGATTTKITLAGTASARAALLVRARLTRDPSADVGAVARLNYAPSQDGLGVYEPQGLTQYTQYDLTFLVME